MVRAALFISAILIAALGARSAGAEVLIGLATALTGPVAWEGASSQVGVDAAVAQLNAQDGVLDERIETIVVDDACAADQAVLAARKLIEAGVVLVIGHHCSAASIPASQLYAKAGVLMISAFSSNPKLTEQGLSTVFRAQGRDDRQAEMAGDLLAERFGHQPIAILHDGTVYGQDLAGYTKARLNEAGHRRCVVRGGRARPARLFRCDPKDAGGGRCSPLLCRFHAGGRTDHTAGPRKRLRPAIGGGRCDRRRGFRADRGTGRRRHPHDLSGKPAGNGGKRVAGRAVRRQGLCGELRAGGVSLLCHRPSLGAGGRARRRVRDRCGAEVLHTQQFDTVLGRIGFDEKGDVTGYGTYVWHIWQDGEFAPLEEAAPGE